MSGCPLVSIIINSFNNACFLDKPINSALGQQYRNVEVIVVDDGSTDDSPHIIKKYSTQVKSIYQKNAGQASAFNSGSAASRGEVIIFLDSDDILLPTAAEMASAVFAAPGVAKTHWPLFVMDSEGVRTGKIELELPF